MEEIKDKEKETEGGGDNQIMLIQTFTTTSPVKVGT